MPRLTVKNWNDFQHYKDRSPPWIKLHKSLLDDFEYQCLPLASRALAPMLWLLASESTDGSFDANTKKIAFRLRTTEKEVIEGIKPLIDNGFLIPDSDALAECKQDACLETERETEKRKNIRSSGDEQFDLFWKSYPKKVGKQETLKAWNAAKVNGEFSQIMRSLEAQKKSDKWKNGFILDPVRWVKGRRWEDEVIGPANQQIVTFVKAWSDTMDGVYEKAKELNVALRQGEHWHDLKERVWDEIRRLRQAA